MLPEISFRSGDFKSSSLERPQPKWDLICQFGSFGFVWYDFALVGICHGLGMIDSGTWARKLNLCPKAWYLQVRICMNLYIFQLAETAPNFKATLTHPASLHRPSLILHALL